MFLTLYFPTKQHSVFYLFNSHSCFSCFQCYRNKIVSGSLAFQRGSTGLQDGALMTSDAFCAVQISLKGQSFKCKDIYLFLLGKRTIWKEKFSFLSEVTRIGLVLVLSSLSSEIDPVPVLIWSWIQNQHVLFKRSVITIYLIKYVLAFSKNETIVCQLSVHIFNFGPPRKKLWTSLLQTIHDRLCFYSHRRPLVLLENQWNKTHSLKMPYLLISFHHNSPGWNDLFQLHRP